MAIFLPLYIFYNIKIKFINFFKIRNIVFLREAGCRIYPEFAV